MNPHKHWANAVTAIAFMVFIVFLVLLYNNGGHWPF